MNFATKNVIATAFSEIGIGEITGGRKAFVNFTEDLMLQEIPYILSSNILVVELLENIEPTEKIISACKKLKKNGYLLALDDFIYEEAFEPLVDLADIIKIDFISTSGEEIERAVRQINQNRKKILLAEKIETYENFEFAKSLGFTLFQGYFFCRPSITVSKTVDPAFINRIKLLRLVSDPDVSFFAIAEMIKRDVMLSYRLLKIVNSAYYGLRYTVNGILHAITILGLVEVRKWVSLIIFNQSSPEKPNELIRMGLVRGIFMEKIAVHMHHRRIKDEYFLIGLFSLADRLLDAPIETIMAETHLSPDICDPLISGKGERAELLEIICQIEQAQWDKVMVLSEKFGISQYKVYQFYVEANKEANKLLD
ncbi:MAG: EAL and HDOD domain-containing protein [Oscillospiraceae bacterium]